MLLGMNAHPHKIKQSLHQARSHHLINARIRQYLHAPLLQSILKPALFQIRQGLKLFVRIANSLPIRGYKVFNVKDWYTR